MRLLTLLLTVYTLNPRMCFRFPPLWRRKRRPQITVVLPEEASITENFGSPIPRSTRVSGSAIEVSPSVQPSLRTQTLGSTQTLAPRVDSASQVSQDRASSVASSNQPHLSPSSHFINFTVESGTNTLQNSASRTRLLQQRPQRQYWTLQLHQC
ncbi:hypothetical protein DFP72DRAFT_433121 [Ephemerocybe angulata]|uniref:Uncharacterized protein n=1 Tax=Ephemerocybe angulata TaxID=980116 RepID=A0A8H6HV52_9AGAR|nr:hypothetical protein DFP72DRAFT_433121 [Tulosesus angulatus]